MNKEEREKIIKLIDEELHRRDIKIGCGDVGSSWYLVRGYLLQY